MGSSVGTAGLPRSVDSFAYGFQVSGCILFQYAHGLSSHLSIYHIIYQLVTF